MKPTYGYNGLRLRPKYEQFSDYLQHGQPIMRYPDRIAKQMRESPYITNLLDESFDEMQKQQMNRARHRAVDEEKQDVANQTGQTANAMRAQQALGNSAPASQPSASQPGLMSRTASALAYGSGRVIGGLRSMLPSPQQHEEVLEDAMEDIDDRTQRHQERELLNRARIARSNAELLQQEQNARVAASIYQRSHGLFSIYGPDLIRQLETSQVVGPLGAPLAQPMPQQQQSASSSSGQQLALMPQQSASSSSGLIPPAEQ